ncbi:replication-associated recombination protein A [Abyssicoccus albus]|uniref:replication-associated recombination protein A n=1 Tax=Abyssicoccus albus TaxID=1817405 RepID=UPI00097E308D|nr:replication-associated recombination protein A [Abyssicoccus albus]AQL56012.1 recombinase RarA [Abyssicoccus albus]
MNNQPLAYRMRPTTIDEVIGQQHLVGPKGIIRRMVNAKRLTSMILYGPPGIGKTSIASAIAGSTRYKFRSLNAVTNSKKDIQQVIEEGKMSGSVILLLDEIHRLDKGKQDILLPPLEQGTVVLIGATTSNPYHAINPAIRSRAQIFELHRLTDEEILQGLHHALKNEDKGLGQYDIDVEEQALKYIVQSSNGDIRAALNALELAVLSRDESTNMITLEDAQDCMQQRAFSFDKDGDEHYDLMSAFQKSIRGSDVNASLYYLARLLEGGDLVTIARRLLVISYEDISLASPQAAVRTLSAIESAERLGLPEARIPLSQAVIELALSPKSNSAIQSIDNALSTVRKRKAYDIPNHLKDGHYSGAKKLNRAIGYKFPHNYEGHFVPQQYLPDELVGTQFFQPSSQSQFEEKLKQIYENIQKQQ